MLLKTTHEFLLLVNQWKVNTKKHHINIDTVFWGWKPSDKTQDGKNSAPVRYEIYIKKIWNSYNPVVNPPNLANRSSTKPLDNPNNTVQPLRSCTVPVSAI